MEQPYTVETRQDVLIVRITHTRLDPQAVEDVGAQVPQLYERHSARCLVLDLSQVRFLPTRFLGMLVELRHRVLQRGGTIALTGLVPNVREVFEVMRLNRIFDISAHVDEALAHLQQPPTPH